MPLTYNEVLERIITDGIAAARKSYADRPDKLQGSIEGFESCRGKQPADLIALYYNANEEATKQRGIDNGENYWRYRCRALEIAFVCNVLSVPHWKQRRPGLLPGMPTVLGFMKYADIAGFEGHGVEEEN